MYDTSADGVIHLVIYRVTDAKFFLFCLFVCLFFCPNTFLLGQRILDEQINDILCKTNFFLRLVNGHFENVPI